MVVHGLSAAKPADPCVRKTCAGVQKQKETHSWWKMMMTMIKIVLNLRHKIYFGVCNETLSYVPKYINVCAYCINRN